MRAKDQINKKKLKASKEKNDIYYILSHRRLIKRKLEIVWENS